MYFLRKMWWKAVLRCKKVQVHETNLSMTYKMHVFVKSGYVWWKSQVCIPIWNHIKEEKLFFINQRQFFLYLHIALSHNILIFRGGIFSKGFAGRGGIKIPKVTVVLIPWFPDNFEIFCLNEGNHFYRLNNSMFWKVDVFCW